MNKNEKWKIMRIFYRGIQMNHSNDKIFASNPGQVKSFLLNLSNIDKNHDIPFKTSVILIKLIYNFSDMATGGRWKVGQCNYHGI